MNELFFGVTLYQVREVAGEMECPREHTIWALPQMGGSLYGYYKNNILSVDLYLRNFAWIKQLELISFFKLLQKYKFD